MHPRPRGRRHRRERRRGRHFGEAGRPRYSLLPGAARPDLRDGHLGLKISSRHRSLRTAACADSLRTAPARCVPRCQQGAAASSTAVPVLTWLPLLIPSTGVLRRRRGAAVQVLPPPEDEPVPERPRLDRPRRDEERRQAALHLRRAFFVELTDSTEFGSVRRFRGCSGAAPPSVPVRLSPSHKSPQTPLPAFSCSTPPNSRCLLAMPSISVLHAPSKVLRLEPRMCAGPAHLPLHGHLHFLRVHRCGKMVDSDLVM